MIQINVITDCLDLLSSFSFTKPSKPFINPVEQNKLFFDVIDILGSYPKPQHKNSVDTATPNNLGAYLFVSNARNTCKLASIGLVANDTAYNLIQTNLENALSLLID
jgi:hypothetical protein